MEKTYTVHCIRETPMGNSVAMVTYGPSNTQAIQEEWLVVIGQDKCELWELDEVGNGTAYATLPNTWQAPYDNSKVCAMVDKLIDNPETPSTFTITEPLAPMGFVAYSNAQKVYTMLAIHKDTMLCISLTTETVYVQQCGTHTVWSGNTYAHGTFESNNKEVQQHIMCELAEALLR